MSTDNTIQQARLGDDSAWQELVNQHQEAVFRLAYLILGEYDDARDVAQDTFIRAYNKFSHFDANRPLRPWLYRIAKNLAYNHHRSSKRRQSVKDKYEQTRTKSATHPEDLSIQQMEAQTLREAVTRLKRADQEIIYLRYFLDLAVEETAESLGIPPGTVKSRSHRALKRLQGVIQREFPALERRFEDA